MPTTDFKGFDEWIEIFKGGKQTDSSGRKHDGDAIIVQAIANFDAAKHEPPLVVGHPNDNAPAFGWVNSLKSVVQDGTKVLLAKFKQVAPEFEELAKAGRYKKRSASFYPDGSLRHVGFLGAAPPAVKGLADVAFTDDGGPTFEFSDSEWAIARVFRRLREWLIEKEGTDTADRIVGDWEINDIQRAADQASQDQATAVAQPLFEEKAMPETAVKSFTETDLATAVATAKAEARRQVEAEFAEAAKISRTEARKQAATTFCADGVKAGTIIPAWVQAGLPEFMARLDGEEVISFAETGDKQSQYDWFKDFMESLPKVVTFGEFAGRDKDAGSQDRDKLVTDFMEKNKSATYKEAVLAVSKLHPTLFTQEN